MPIKIKNPAMIMNEGGGNSFDPNGNYPGLSVGSAENANLAQKAIYDDQGNLLSGYWSLNMYACTISFSTTAAIYFWFPNKIFSFDFAKIAATLYEKNMRSISQALPVYGIEPDGGQVVGMYSKNRTDITLAVITGTQLTEMSLPKGELKKSTF